MKLGKFIKKYINRNSLIRLYYIDYGELKLLLDTKSGVCMEWEVVDDKGKHNPYYDMKILHIKDIMSLDNHPEAINIVVEKRSKEYYRDKRLKWLLKHAARTEEDRIRIIEDSKKPNFV